MPKIKSDYFGKSCEYRVFSEFLKLGWDVYVPAVDNKGIDCLIKKKDSTNYIPIQIKGRQPRWIFNIGKINDDIKYFIFIPPDGEIYSIPLPDVVSFLKGRTKFNFDTTKMRLTRKKYLGFKQIKFYQL